MRRTVSCREGARENLRPRLTPGDSCRNPDLVFVASFSRAETVETIQDRRRKSLPLGAFDSIEDIKENNAPSDISSAKTPAPMQWLGRWIPNSPLRAHASRKVTTARISYGVSGTLRRRHARYSSHAAAGSNQYWSPKGFDGSPKISADK